jgi:predicted CXXCH cytochrome family protein
MQCLLRKITVDSQGQLRQADIELSQDDLIIGSAPESDIQLLGETITGQHARIYLKTEKESKTIFIGANKDCRFEHNGKSVKAAKLKRGDQISFEQHKITLIQTPPGFDLALQWEVANVDGSLLAKAYQTDISQSGIRARPLAWMLAVLVLIFAGAIPVAKYFWRSSLTAQTTTNTQTVSHQFIAEQLWSSGPLHSAHQVALGNECQSCHTTPFQQVTDQACLNCHKNTNDHIFKNEKNSKSHAELFANMTCQDCHKEHNEPAQLVNREDALCVDCHKTLETKVTGFDQKQHPEFELSVLTPEIIRSIGSLSQNWKIEKRSAIEKNREESHLKFSHQVHLDVNKVQDQTSSQALDCSQCHQLSADQEHFVPITMEQHCSSCHTLSFDPEQPKKQLPHADVDNIYAALEAHFLGLAFDDAKKSFIPPRRLPAKTPEPPLCKNDYDCAQQLVVAEAERQFTQKGCVTCHVIESLEGTDARSRWQVLPVKLNSDWYAAAQFNHQSHLTQKGEAGNAACFTCHKADISKESADVLIPGIDNCLACHGDKSVSDKVILECVSCHQYHWGFQK